jgi:ClpP class serine protease
MNLLASLQSHRPLAIDPLRVRAFIANSEQVLSRPDLAHFLSKYADQNRKIKRAMKPYNEKYAIFADDDEEDEDEEMGIKARLMRGMSVPYVSDGVGVITVDGVIGKGLSPLECMLGAVDIDRISAMLDAWAERPDVQEVIFKFDSGGGTTTGLQELAKKIRTFTKPTIAFCESNCGSAAYWLASQCNRFAVTPSCEVGAVGIYLTITDEFDKYAEDGKVVKVIKSGRFKGIGVSGTRMTEEQEKNLQEECIELHRRFIADIKAVRMFVNDEDLQGQTFYGDVAVQRGLATTVVDSFKQLMEDTKNFRNRVSKQIVTSAYGVNQSPSPAIG